MVTNNTSSISAPQQSKAPQPTTGTTNTTTTYTIPLGRSPKGLCRHAPGELKRDSGSMCWKGDANL